MGKFVELTGPDGNAALVSADAVTLIITASANLGFPAAAKSVVYIGSQQLAVTQTVAQVKALL